MVHSTKEIADALGVPVSIVYTYTRQFGKFLSRGASPGSWVRRKFTDVNLVTIRVARQLLKDGLTYAQVNERLAGGIGGLADALLRAWVAALESAVEAWRSLAEERGREVEALREDVHRLREESLG
ncbi:MAG TPA: MerR family transcriptional regulator [Anaerolineae bacterium]|nr:MerR family transcriptional regulator [Anaerolineae bacterium]